MSDDVLLKAKQHFANFRAAEMLREIKVPEWGLSLWYWPHLSVGERRAIHIAAQAGYKINGEDSRAMIDRHGREVMEIIARARDVQGKLLFNESQFHHFLAVDPGVIERISAQMTDEYTSPEDVEKNSERTQHSST